MLCVRERELVESVSVDAGRAAMDLHGTKVDRADVPLARRSDEHGVGPLVRGRVERSPTQGAVPRTVQLLHHDDPRERAQLQLKHCGVWAAVRVRNISGSDRGANSTDR